MPNGGKRPGAGRKQGFQFPATIQKTEAREAARKIITAHMAEMLAAQIANSKGLKYLVTRGPDGKFTKVTEAMAGALQGQEIIEVWEKDPSVQAFTDLMNRALDKPKEQDIDVNVNVTSTLETKIETARKRLKPHA